MKKLLLSWLLGLWQERANSPPSIVIRFFYLKNEPTQGTIIMFHQPSPFFWQNQILFYFEPITGCSVTEGIILTVKLFQMGNLLLTVM
jgi:hypothetical protein